MKRKKKKNRSDVPPGKEVTEKRKQRGPVNMKMLFYIVVIGVMTAAAFLPSLTNDFADLDDSAYVIDNNDITGLSAANIKSMFTKGYVGHYCPVTMLSYAVDHHFFKLKPFGYHLTNYLLNIMTALLVFYFIFLISKNMYIAFITGLLFGVHPLHVESVAWIAERKDVLCAFFYMVTLIFYSFYIRRRSLVFIILCFIFTVIALLAKPMAVTIPVVFILMDFYYGRMNIVSFMEKIPFFILSVAAGFINIHFQAQAGAMKVFAKGWEAVYFLAMAPFFYLYKLIWPLNLSAMYEYYRVTPEQLALIPVFGFLFLIISSAVIYSLKYSKKVFFGSAMSFVMLLPVIKIIPVGDIYAADRYMYLPSIGLFFVAGIFCDFLIKRYEKKIAVNLVVSGIAVFFLILTWQRCFIWSNPMVFYEETLKTAPNSQVLLNNLGNIYTDSGKIDKAIKIYHRSIALVPEDPGSYYNLGNALFQKGKIPDSIEAYKEALRLNPDYTDAYKSLARSYYTIGDKQREIEAYKKITEIDPSDAVSYYNLCLTYRSMGDMSKAAYYCSLAVKCGMNVPRGLREELSRYGLNPGE